MPVSGSISPLREAAQAGRALGRCPADGQFMYFETGQGSALSADAHWGVDQQTMEARAYAVAREFDPLLVNTVVGFIGPEYLYDGKQIIRAGLEDHFCGKLLGLPMGGTSATPTMPTPTARDMDALLTLLCAGGGELRHHRAGGGRRDAELPVPLPHDAVFARQTLGRAPAPEFEAWLSEGRRHRRAGIPARRRGGTAGAFAEASRLLPGKAA